MVESGGALLGWRVHRSQFVEITAQRLESNTVVKCTSAQVDLQRNTWSSMQLKDSAESSMYSCKTAINTTALTRHKAKILSCHSVTEGPVLFWPLFQSKIGLRNGRNYPLSGPVTGSQPQNPVPY